MTTSLAALVGLINVTDSPRPNPYSPLPGRKTQGSGSILPWPGTAQPWRGTKQPWPGPAGTIPPRSGTVWPQGGVRTEGHTGTTKGWALGGGFGGTDRWGGGGGMGGMGGMGGGGGAGGAGGAGDAGGGGGAGSGGEGVRERPMPTPPKSAPSSQPLPSFKEFKTTMPTKPSVVENATSTPDHMWLYGAPILIIIGTIGNSLSAVVMMRKDLRKTTTSLFLTVLAFVDTAILYTGLLRQWLVMYKDYDIRTVAAATCKLHTFLLYALNQYQAWLLVIVTIERLIAVFLPHQSKRLCTRPAAAASLAVSAVAIGGLNAHFFWTNQYIRIQYSDKYVAYCMPFDAKYAHFVRTVWPWVDFIAFSMLPFVVLVTSNIAILLRMLYSHYLRRTSLHTHGNTVKMTSMTAILITVTFSFFVTTAPISIYLIMTDTLREDSTSAADRKLRVVWVVFNLLTYTNNTFNFLLYCVSGSRFRRELINMFRRKNRIKPTSHSGTMEMPLNVATAPASAHTQQTNVPQTSGFGATPTPGQSSVGIPSTRGQSNGPSGNGSATHR